MKSSPAHLFCLLLPILAAVSAATQSQGDPKATEIWEPVPKKVDPGTAGTAPSDAIVLFDGSDLSEWLGRNGEPQWEVKEGALTVVPGTGDLTTRRAFGDVQLHLEWRSPEVIAGEGQGRGNSGVFLMERYEVQILDSHQNRTYSNGQAGSVYKQFMPLVNATRPPGEWQSYDIVFAAPRFDSAGILERPATLTVLHNGVLIQNHVTLKGTTTYIGEPQYEAHPAKLPLKLQDHGNPVSFRNIWIREF
ncbi:MAG: DUF1080 domain-containing protein [Acidobacteriota bacterium]